VGIPAKQKVYPSDVEMIFPVAGRGRPRKRHLPDHLSVATETMVVQQLLDWAARTRDHDHDRLRVSAVASPGSGESG
jgi:hypothetical protein